MKSKGRIKYDSNYGLIRILTDLHSVNVFSEKISMSECCNV